MTKIVIFGNSGSGKSTLAKAFSREENAYHLDLDTLAWESPGVRRSFEASRAQLEQFIAQHERWVIEGCYGSLVEVAAAHCSELHFLNPGIDACLQNNARRPWEPHKYSSPAAQNNNLAMLQDWVRGYETRSDEYSLAMHRAIFDAFGGKKREHTRLNMAAENA